jgi:hypothetical protein
MRSVPNRIALAVALTSVIWATVAETSQDAQPKVRVVSPVEDAQVAGPDVQVRLEIEGATLSPRRSRMGAYILLRLDNAPPVKTFTDNFTYKGVGAGNHTLRVELRRNDDTSFDPPVRAQVRFSVRAPSQ